ncbi:MAG TPA: DUF6496 domain-containing protein [Rhizomicrobium sp.]|jgi:hypothetical protein|nr:DUF6496 domain-containing protein [Rhizomicrobium sp.]
MPALTFNLHGAIREQRSMGETGMARYSRSSGKDVERAVKRRRKGKLKRGKGGRGGTVKSRKQAIAIGLSEARKKGKKLPKKAKSKRRKSRKSKT